MRAYIILDLGFGDAGKGLLTDLLARSTRAGWVVRYNGGAQAGHNVVTPGGLHHTFSQFGSGTFVPGVRTYLSRHVVIHPPALLAEGDLLLSKGVQDAYARLRISEQALVITLFHQAANHIRELARRADRHGSCGVGVGAAVEDALAYPDDRLLAGDLARPELLRSRLVRICERMRPPLLEIARSVPPDPRLARELSIFDRPELIDAWIASIARIPTLGLLASDELLHSEMDQSEAVIFEGAQGVLLDADVGFHPYTTWSCCTARNALELLAALAPAAQITRLGVMRAYALRHGPGPLPTETSLLASAISEHNQVGEWQGPLRYGWFDAVLARYALQVAGGVDVLAVTHLDLPPRLGSWQVCPAYRDTPQLSAASAVLERSDGWVTSFSLPQPASLEQRERWTQVLFGVEPLLEPCATDETSVVRSITDLLGQPVDLLTRGPRASDAVLLNPRLLGDSPVVL